MPPYMLFINLVWSNADNVTISSLSVRLLGFYYELLGSPLVDLVDIVDGIASPKGDYEGKAKRCP